jgi:hypothetical protein
MSFLANLGQQGIQTNCKNNYRRLHIWAFYPPILLTFSALSLLTLTHLSLERIQFAVRK